MSENIRLLDAYSKTNENDEPVLGTCTLVVLDGTVKIPFHKGRAKIPETIAHLFANHPHILIPELGSVSSTPIAATAAVEVTEDASDHGAVIAAQNARIAELEAALAARAQTDNPPEVEAADSEQAPTEEESEEVRLAKEYLEREGETVPQPQGDQGRVGFEATTADGQARCQAAKADGAQCANAATSGQACGLGKHQEQLAA